MRPLIGRAQLFETARGLLATGARLLTLTGPGGVGKTRLAEALATSVAGDLVDDVQWVDVSAIAEPRLVLPAIGDALGLSQAGPLDSAERLRRAIGARRLLLVLDNMEQVTDAAPEIADLVLACPSLRVLVTSREPLRVRAEQELGVPPLALAESHDVEHASVSPSVALFVQRARAVQPDFELTRDNVAAIVEICRRLDGLPLGIELAAAWVRVLHPAAVAARLGRHLDWLSARERDRPARHQSLRAALEWSTDLLGDDERAVLRRLSVFAGGCTPELAEAVCAQPPLGADVLLVLAALAERGLVQRAGERLRLLETTRVFAADQLAASGEGDAVRAAHAACYVDLAERTAPDVRSARQAAALAELDPEQDNIRVALHWLIEHNQLSDATRLACAMIPYWYARNRVLEAGERLEAVLEAHVNSTPAERARLLTGLGAMRYEQGQHTRAWELVEEALASSADLAPGDWYSLAELIAGYLAIGRGDGHAAEQHIEAAHATAVAQGDWPMIAWTLTALGVTRLVQGQLGAAHDLFEASANTHQGDPLVRTHALANLGWVRIMQRQPARANDALGQAVRLASEVGNDEAFAFSIEGLAVGLIDLGRDPDDAGRLLGAADALRSVAGVPLWLPQRAILDERVARLRADVGEARVSRAMAAGRGLARAAIAAEARRLLDAPAATVPEATAVDVLSAREREVAGLIGAGLTSREIAERLVISETTADTHAANIRTKLGLRSRAEIAAWATRHGLGHNGAHYHTSRDA